MSRICHLRLSQVELVGAAPHARERLSPGIDDRFLRKMHQHHYAYRSEQYHGPQMELHLGRRGLVVGLIALVASTASAGSLQEDAAKGIAKAEAKGDYATALAWDDVLAAQPYPPVGDARKEHFGKLIDVALDKIGPPTAATAQAIIGTLLAMKAEANRDVGQGDLVAARKGQLASVVDAKITPKLVEVAAILWTEVDAMTARGEDARALLLADLLIRETPGGTEQARRTEPIKERIAAKHLTIAKEADAALWAARVLHARIAKLYGAEVGELSEPSPEMIDLIARNWSVEAPSSCGNVAFSIEGATQNLEPILAKMYSPGRGGSARLRVSFDSCPITARDWETVEARGYMAKAIVQDREELTYQSCGNWSSSSDKGASKTTVTESRYCGAVGTGQYTYKDREVEVERVAKTVVEHRVSRMRATGTIKVEMYGLTREVPFSLAAESDDDPASATRCDQEKDCPSAMMTQTHYRHGWSAGQARLRMHDKVLEAIREAVGKVSAEKAASYVNQARTAAAAGRALEADHAYAIAYQLGASDPAFETWVDTQYRLPPHVLMAGLGSGLLPRLDLAIVYAFKLPKLKLTDHAYLEVARKRNRTDRELLWITFSGGPMFATTTGGGDSQKGAILSLQAGAVVGVPLFLFALSGGYGAGHGQIELDFRGGAGFTGGGFALHAVSGLGMNTSTGNQERVGPTPNDFIVPVAAYWLYGARLSYVLPINAKLEAMYTKTFRTSSELPSEKRFDARMLVMNAAVTLRYCEYLADIDSFLGTFDANVRTAKTLWVLFGMGF